MKLMWTDEAWEDYLVYQGNDKIKLKRVNKLLKDIGNWAGCFSCAVDKKNRIVFCVYDGHDVTKPA